MSFYIFLGFILGVASMNFGVWQHSVHAGVWMFVVLLLIADFCFERGKSMKDKLYKTHTVASGIVKPDYRFLLLTSYCEECTDEDPCIECLKLCNVFKIEKGSKMKFIGELERCRK